MIDAFRDADPRLIDLPHDTMLVAITGTATCGKSAALARRYAHLLATLDASPDTTLVCAASITTARDLVALITAEIESAQHPALLAAPFVGITIEQLALAIVREGGLACGLSPDVRLLESYELEALFRQAAAPLYSSEWDAFLGPDIDPEVSGLRTIDRFTLAAFRLIGKLRDAAIDAETFLASAQRGAAKFYGKLPNLADSNLLMETKDEHRSSLTIGPDELESQRRRELDLAKIIAKLATAYDAELRRTRSASGADVVAQATRILSDAPQIAQRFRDRLRVAVIDDAHDLRAGDLRLLAALFGERLNGVTIAGAPELCTQTFNGARPEALFGIAAHTISLAHSATAPQILAAGIAIATENRGLSIPAGSALGVYRGSDRDDEIAFVTRSIVGHVERGTPPEQIAVLYRSARSLAAFEAALVAENIPVAPHGDIGLLARSEVCDALAVLWSAADPFAHDWLLRALQLPWMNLSDASLALLCGEPTTPQTALFPLPPEAVETDRRWDRKRDLRLGSNVLHGDRDLDLSAQARERISVFRERQARWADFARDAGALGAAAILADAGVGEPQPGETPAATTRRKTLLDALLGVIARSAEHTPEISLEATLRELEAVAEAERGPLVMGGAGVYVGSLECLGHRRFEHVYVVGAKAGSFPPYYAPDAFLYSPQWGMIPKDAVGDASAARTAKFTWYAHSSQLAKKYMREQRRLFAYALTRAKTTVTVTLGGKTTRGVGAPELAVEMLTWPSVVDLRRSP